MLFDKTKPHGVIRGDTGNGARYTQNGHQFDINGCLCGKPGTTPAPKTTTPPASTDTPPPATGDVPDYKGMHHMVLKKQVKEAGGEYTTKPEAIKFLTAEFLKAQG